MKNAKSGNVMVVHTLMINLKEAIMSEERIIIEFTGEEFDLIMQYMEFVEATTVQNAVMNAISLAMDHPANSD